MALETPTIQSPSIDATDLNATFMWSTENLDTLVISSSIITGTADSSSDPQFTIEGSHDQITWFGTRILNNSQQSLEMAITAPWMRVRLTKANSTAMRLSVTVASRRDSFTPEPLASRDPTLDISSGNANGIDHINKFGRNPDCDPAGSPTIVPVGRDIWDGGVGGAVAWAPPTAARVHQLTSSNNEDGAGGSTGVLTIDIFGLDDLYQLQNETVTMNGTANVATANAYTMIHRMSGMSFGSAGRNLGDITAIADSDGTLTAQITADMNTTLMAIYQIPAGKKGYITGWYANLYKQGGSAKLADAFLMSMVFGAGWRVRDIGATSTDSNPDLPRKFNPYKTLEEKEYVKVAADPSATTQDVGGGFDIILVDI